MQAEPPFYLWQQDFLELPVPERQKDRWSKAEKRAAKTNRSAETQVLKAKPKSRATQTPSAEAARLVAQASMQPSALSTFLRSMANLIDEAPRPSASPSAGILLRDMSGQPI